MYDFIERYLEDYKLATDRQRKREFWNVEGIIKGRSNQSFKFDLRPIIKNAKGGSFKTKADKMVFMGTSFSVNITAIALRIAASNSIDIEIIDPNPIDIGYKYAAYFEMSALENVESFL